MPRRELPNRRHTWTQKIKVGGQTIYVSFSEYPDGTLGEIFIDAAKAGSALRALLHTLAIFLSIGIQHNVPLKSYVGAMKGLHFEPCGEVSGSDEVTQAWSILDYLAKQIEETYVKREKK